MATIPLKKKLEEYASTVWPSWWNGHAIGCALLTGKFYARSAINYLESDPSNDVLLVFIRNQFKYPHRRLRDSLSNVAHYPEMYATCQNRIANLDQPSTV